LDAANESPWRRREEKREQKRPPFLPWEELAHKEGGGVDHNQGERRNPFTSIEAAEAKLFTLKKVF